jgi:hypothetical protein
MIKLHLTEEFCEQCPHSSVNCFNYCERAIDEGWELIDDETYLIPDEYELY